MSQQTPSDLWQHAVGGVWHGLPACYTLDGRQIGLIEAHRAVLRDGDDVTLHVATTLHEFTDERWAARLRFPGGAESFRVKNDGPHRLYLGPDCHGIGHPFAGCTLGIDHQRPWSAENRVIVLLHPGGRSQTYSNILATTIRSELALHGLYIRTDANWADDPGERERVAAHLASERIAARTPVSPLQHERWTGQLELHTGDQQPHGRCDVQIDRTPDLTTFTITGPLAQRWRAVQRQTGPDLAYLGPDLHGSGLQLGRALYTTLFAATTGLRLEGLEYTVDDDTRSVCWQLHRGLALEHLLHGQLTREF